MESAFEKQAAQSIIEEVATACDVTVMEVTKMQALFRSTVGKISAVRAAALEEAAKICDKYFEECTARPNCHNLDAYEIRELKEQK